LPNKNWTAQQKQTCLKISINVTYIHDSSAELHYRVSEIRVLNMKNKRRY